MLNPIKCHLLSGSGLIRGRRESSPSPLTLVGSRTSLCLCFLLRGALTARLEGSGDIISVYEPLGDSVKQIIRKGSSARVLTIFTQHLKAACVGLYRREIHAGART